ncbi:MAG: S-layer homology domain-containing protein, partial [Oscillospiraceae bacterium]|nr:S-layer homology domain-containing protein [Oscillospiraceae bacterium]
MKKQEAMSKHRRIQRVLSAVLTMVMLFGMLPPIEWTAHAASWMDEYIETAVDWGVMRGDVHGNLNAEKNITRAEFVTMVNRAFGYSADTTHPFTDVTIKDWYHNDIGMAYNKGYFKGTSETTASPEEPLTREQAVVLIGRNLLLDEKVGEALGFSDSRTFSDWSRGMVESAIDAGYVGGYDDGTFLPQKNVSRGEVAAMLVRAIGTLVNDPGTHTLGGVYGNVMVSTSGVTLKNTTIAGNLYITGGLELGDILLDNVEVLGKIIVSGAGESSKGDSSIVLRNVESGELVIDSLMNQFVTLRAEGETQVDFTNVKTSAYLDDQTKAGDGLLYVEMNGDPGMNVTMAGNVEEVLNATPRSSLTVAQGTAKVVTVDEKAVGSSLEIKNIAAIDQLNLDVATPVKGAGDIKEVYVNAAGFILDILPDKVEIRPGLTANIKGEQMDTLAGQESSSDPRILAGYPKVRNLAPTSAEVVFSTNKKGTLYWALTSLIDGPVSAEDLIAQKDYTTKIQQQGSVVVGTANTEQTIKLSKLVSDGSYYISMVLVDNRDQRSAEKFLSFSTPDGTAPAFSSGYPELTLIKKDYAQLAVMPTKSSVLYYVVLPKGAAAPTIAEFKAGAISGDLGNCPQEGIPVTKNIISFTNINDKVEKPLKEVESYELYLCLIDVDNGKDSGVKKISFTTADETPPILEDGMVTGIQKNAVNVTTSINEAGTIYWVAVKEGMEYLPKDGSQNPDYTSMKSILQVVNEMGNIVSSGHTSAAAGKSALMKVTRLEPQTSYDVYYVAGDKADPTNYSAVKKITVNTLDVESPTARQFFTKMDETGSQPKAETDIKLFFSENVRSATAPDGHDFWNLYKSGEIELLVQELKKTVQLWDVSTPSATYQIKDDPTATDEDMGAWINYQKIRMEMDIDTGELVLIFEHGKAINLVSGGKYQFVLEDVTDASNAKNPMKPNPYKQLPVFTTVFATIDFSKQAPTNSVPGKPTAKGQNGADADIDMRFWLDPNSTNNVNDYVNYDIWIETTGIIVKFDLYCRVVDPAAEENARIITDPSKMSMFGMALNDQNQIDKNGWIYLGEMSIYANGGTSRASVNSLIHGVNADALQISPLNTMRDEYTYEFCVDV